MENPVYIARNPGETRLFLFQNKPVWNGRWENGGKWIELPNSHCEKVGFNQSPKRIRGFTPAR